MRARAAIALLVGGVLSTTSCKRLLEENSPASDDGNEPPPGAVELQRSSIPRIPSVHAPTPSASGAALPLSFAPLVRAAKPSVVTIRAWVQKRNTFGRDTLETEGVGSGFVYDAAGYLLTNNHVIEGATKIVVNFHDGVELVGTVVGADPPTDIAVIKVDADGLSALPLGDSNALLVGDWVIAIGNPFGLEHTVSAGILSARGRTRDDVRGLDPTGYFNFLQTDASINPGNSGGPLLNLAGQVVGINAAVRANANNIGFAIPMDMVVQLLPKLLANGRIRRSGIGIIVDEISRGDATRLELPRAQGAIVTKVLPNRPAARAGILIGDVILAFGDKPVANPNELRWMASIAGVSSVVPVQVARGGKTFRVNVTLDELGAL